MIYRLAVIQRSSYCNVTNPPQLCSCLGISM